MPGSAERIREEELADSEMVDLEVGGSLTETRGGFGQAPRVEPGTVFLRDEAYIEDPDKDVLGEVVGPRRSRCCSVKATTCTSTSSRAAS